MPKFRVAFDQTVVYYVDVEADTADEACDKAEALVKVNGVDQLSCIKTEPELGDCYEHNA